MTSGRTPKTALVLSSVLVLIAGFAIFVPAFAAAAPIVGNQQQLGDIPGPDLDEPAQQAAPESSADTASSAVPPTSASTGSGPKASTHVVDSTPVLRSVLAAIAALCIGLVIWRLSRGGRHDSHPGRRATSAANIIRKTKSL
jgi:hypothetical protein